MSCKLASVDVDVAPAAQCMSCALSVLLRQGFAYYQNEREDHDHQLMQLHAFVLGGTLKVQENGRPVEVLM